MVPAASPGPLARSQRWRTVCSDVENMDRSLLLPPTNANLLESLVSIRPIRPEDEAKMARFRQTLSEETVFSRYAGTLKLDARVAHERLARICFIDRDREMVLVAEREGEIVAVARLTRLTGTRDAEFALLVSDSMQGQGLGRALLLCLFEVGRAWGLKRILAEILPGNGPMRRMCKELGFTFGRETVAAKDLSSLGTVI
jgi:acetyltransferase